MSAVPPPYDGSGGFNPDNWTPDSGTGAVDEEYLATNYLQFPIAQGTETFGDAIISGTLTASDATFSDIVNLNSDATANGNFTVNSNTGNTNEVLIQPPTTFSGGVDLGSSAIAITQPSGNSSTFVATTAFVQDAVQVSGVQVGDSPLLWTGFNTFSVNSGTGANIAYTYTKGISNIWNLTNASGDCDVIANAGTNVAMGNAYNIYCVQNDLTGAQITALTPQLQLSNNGTPMQVKDGINIPTGEIYAINGVDILAPYSTTTQMNSAISTALTPYALINGQQFTGTPTLQTTPTSGQTTAIANVAYVGNSISTALVSYSTTSQMNSAISTALTPYAPKNSPSFSGIPTAPTRDVGDNSDAIATTAFVLANSDPAPVLTNYAQLNTATAQTFTGAIAFSGTTTAPTPPNLDNSTKIATTAFLNDALNGATTFITTTTTDNVRIAPTLMSFRQVYYDAQYQNKFYLTPVASTTSNYGSISFTIPLPAPTYPNGSTPILDPASYINLTDTTGTSFNFYITLYSNLGIGCNAQGAGINSLNFTLSGQIFISWTYN
jgi:hypothetical protein